LVRGGKLRATASQPGPATALAATEDEYRENVAVVSNDGALILVGKAAGARLSLVEAAPPLREASFAPGGRWLAVMDANGALRLYSLRFRVRWEGQERVLDRTLRLVQSASLPAASHLLALGGESGAAAVLVSTPDGLQVWRGGEAGLTSISLALPELALAGAVGRDAGHVWVATSGELAWFDLGAATGGPLAPVATAPLAEAGRVAGLLLGDMTFLVGDTDGLVTAWQVVEGAVPGVRVIEQAARFAGAGAVRAIAPSERDKSFAILRDGSLEICNLTSRRVVARPDPSPRDGVLAGLSPRRDGLWVIERDGALRRWGLAMPHPEVSLGTLFLPVRYEGFTKAELVWQSTGATSAFESKMSLVPLIFGTFKGALYALLFSAPCALLAALYVSQFAPARVKLIAKPLVELMAALPSVVVGFLAALALAPVLQRHIVAVLGSAVLLPIVLAGVGLAWAATPVTVRRRLTAGRELVVVSLLMAAVIGLAFAVESPVQRLLFGGDFASWLLAHLGVTYDQRNAVVVGFALGFAVIPIIFTLAEDAFSNVPPSLVSASLALGATPWQAARTVAIPAASPGLFAAVMTGLGRAVGETMIVLMATGNTPILSMSPFDGMRTMSACIAVELPEAPYGDSLYRVLILAALMLFAFTFVINSMAVVVAERLRRRFGRLAA
ncbi:MAG TPA: ABC transporter permease subunit, partial [Thermoanaerobaculaceae bacterium]|nr:ABC transporter permease subunit [Thermoanaerobaculaceae bacterium]